LRAAYQKRTPESKSDAIAFVRSEFRKGAVSVARSDIRRIEYLIRKAEKQIKSMGDPDVHIRVGIVDSSNHTGQTVRQ